MANPAKIVEIPDNDGNKFIIKNFRVISLKLKTETRFRQIGIVDSGKISMKRKRSKHLYWKSNSYGFNHYVISTARTFKSVLLTDEYGIYLIPNKIILELGKFLYFKQTGFERQLFLPLKIINQYKIK